MVARTMLFGLFDPMHLVSTLARPASSTTARTPPPAMTPVPSDAGFSRTSPAPKRPVTSKGIVPSTRGTSSMLFLAFSMPLRIASGTSFALPSPNPTRPALSPTTTNALKLKRRPPFTTFATRLMCTTRSVSSKSLALSFSLYTVQCPLEAEPGFAGGLRERLDAPVVEKAVAVEDDLFDLEPPGELGHGLADLLRGLDVAGRTLPRHALAAGGDLAERATRRVHELCVHVLRRAVHGEPRAIRKRDASGDANAARL